jgi:hypothetical protein
LSVLAKINNLKGFLTNLEGDVDTLPDELIETIAKDLKNLRNIVNTVGGTIEKYFKDQRSFSEMEKKILNKMQDFEIYKGLSDTQKSAISKRIINDANLVLIGPDDLKEFIQDKLQTDSAENLIRRAYSKKDIIHLGESVTSPNSSEVVKYDSGMNILKDMVKTPTGREDAISHGIKRLMGNKTTLHYYLLLYYGVR